MIRKLGALILTAGILATLTSCGKYSALYNELDAITAETVFPEAVSGRTELAQITEDVYAQQLALCEAYNEAYEKTDADGFLLRYADFEKNKVMSSLSKTRQELNDDSSNQFYMNMAVLLSDVTDCSNQEAYIEKRKLEAQSFCADYKTLINSTEEDFQTVNDIFVKYALGDNELVKKVFNDNMEMIMEASARSVEANAAADTEFRSNISKCNKTITALNEFYGGVTLEISKRINSSNKLLLKKLLQSMESVSKDERETMIRQLEDNEKLTMEMENTKRTGGSTRR